MREADTRDLVTLEADMGPRTAAMMPEVDEHCLADVRGRIGKRLETGAGEPRRMATVPKLRIAATIALAVLLGLGAAAGVLWHPGAPQPAFAAERAAEALLPMNGTLHFVEITKVRVAPHGSKPMPPYRSEHWIGPGGRAMRETVRINRDGELFVQESVSQGTGGHIRSRLSVGTPPALATVNDTPVGLDYPGQDAPTQDVWWWLRLTSDLKSGKARVIGTETTGGVTYWKVRSEDSKFQTMKEYERKGGRLVEKPSDPSAPAYKQATEALLRVGDYRPLMALITTIEDNKGNLYDEGKQAPRYDSWSTELDFPTWEKLATQAVPPGTFDINSIPLEAPQVSVSFLPSEVTSFTEFGVWGLPAKPQLPAPVLRGLVLDGSVYNYDRGPTQLGSTVDEADPSNVIPPKGWATLSDRSVHALWAGEEMTAFVASMPKSSEASVAAFLDQQKALGRPPVSGEVNGLRYRGYERLQDPADGVSRGTVVVETGGQTLVVAYYCSQEAAAVSRIKTLLRALVRMNP